MWERGLAYRKTAPVNWCPGCRTVLANEQVVDGRCERSDDLVEIRDLTQWFFRVTDYAERLLEGLDRLPHWSERVKTMQRNWIGRSDGAEILFRIDGLTEPIRVFTTRPDTLYGATFMALAPEHAAVEKLAERSPRRAEIEAFVERVRRESRLEREAEGAEKEGLDTGAVAINPATGESIPVWLANFVLPDYGTGAIMGVPAHDQRDFEFARRYGLAIRPVYRTDEGEIDPATMTGPRPHDGVLVGSGSWDGTPNGPEAIKVAIAWLEEKGFGKRKVGYRLRDWLISRQRYWGTPIPAIHCPGCGVVPVPDADLPVLLPEDVEFRGAEGNPLEKSEAFVPYAVPEVRGSRAPGDRHDGHLRRLVLVLPAVPEPRRRRKDRRHRAASTAGCRSTSTSAASSTRSCTCSTPGSSAGSSRTWASCISRSPSSASSTRA